MKNNYVYLIMLPRRIRQNKPEHWLEQNLLHKIRVLLYHKIFVYEIYIIIVMNVSNITEQY